MKNIAIIFGGESSEHDVAIQSAFSFITNLPKGIKPILIPISKTGEWYLFEGDQADILNGNWIKTSQRICFSPNKSDQGFYILDQGFKLIRVDSAMILIHGKNGEDGSVQGLLQLAGIPFIGCDIEGSAICMNKYLAHQIAQSMGIKCAKSILIKNGDLIDDLGLRYPLYVKPLKAGSSLGISKIEKREQLDLAVKEALKFDDQVIVEEEIRGVEVGVAIIKGKELIIGEVDEIITSHDFFDYDAKYQSIDSSKVYLPARFSEAMRQKIKQTALQLFDGLACRHFARIDLFVDEHQEIYFNEINTIPGFTTHSRFPRMLEAVGLTFADVVLKLVNIND